MEDSSNISSPPLLPIYSLTSVQHFLSSNQFSQAYDYYTNLINSKKDEKDNNLVENLINRSLVLLSLHMTKNALDDASKAIEIDHYASPAYFILGIAHLWNGSEDDALMVWRSGLQYTKELSYFTIMTALVNSLNFRVHLFKMKFDVNRVLDLLDDFANPHFTTDSDIQDAFYKLRNSSYNSAIEHFSLIISVNPQSHYAYKGRGVAYCMLGNYNKCIQDLTAAIEKTPNNFQIDTIKVRAIAYSAIGKITSALFDLNKYLLIVPDDYEVKIEVAKLHMKRKTYLAAHKVLMSIPEKEILKNEEYLLCLSECLYAVGELQKSFQYINYIQKIRNHKYHYLSFLINRDLNHMIEAEKEIIEAVRLVPTFFLNRIAADFFCDIGDVQKSIEYYKEALQQCPYDAETHLFYAYALFETGKLGESASLLQELTDQNEKFKFRGSFDHFDKMNFGVNLLQVAQTDFCFIQTAIMSIDTSIMNLQHGFFASSISGLNQIFPVLSSNASLNKIDIQNPFSNEKNYKMADKLPDSNSSFDIQINDNTNNNNNNNNIDKNFISNDINNTDDNVDVSQNKDKINNNIQKIEKLKNRLSKFYLNALNEKDEGNNNNNSNNDNDNNNNNVEADICCDENDINNQKLEQKIEREMFNYLFGKEYSNEIDKDEMNFNECLDQMIALNGKGNINHSDISNDLSSYLKKTNQQVQFDSDLNDNSNSDSYLNSSDQKVDNNMNSNLNPNHERNTLLFKQINNDFKLPKMNMTPEILKMIKDADRLGLRCIPQVNEKTINKRLARALGFSVLRIAFQMKTQWFNSDTNHWFTAFEEIKAILQFADMRNQLKYNCNESIPFSQKQKNKARFSTETSTNSSKSSYDFCQYCCPTYYIIKNGKKSARFGFAIDKVFQLVKENFPMKKIDSFEDIYQTFQVDFLNKPQLEVNDIVIDLPYIILKYNGIYGFDLFVRPLSDISSWKRYDYELQYAFSELMKRGEDSTMNLAYFIILIWLRHPLNYYSPEIGHMFLHAFVLASNAVEIAAIDESNGENFIQHMAFPSIEDFSNLLYEHALNNKLESQFSEESLKFWSYMPSISTMIQLLNVSFE